jgi:hypothetical protein
MPTGKGQTQKEAKPLYYREIKNSKLLFFSMKQRQYGANE